MDAHTWDERYAVTRQWSQTPNQFVAEATGSLAPGRALDLACGEGRNAIWLAQRGWEVTALDFSARGVQRGREAAAQVGAQVTWVVGDALTHELSGFDLVVVAYLQLPPSERRTALRRAWESLRRGGTFFLVAHDSTNLDEGTGGPQDPELLYTAEDVLGDLGLEPAGVTTSPPVVAAGRVARRVPGDDEHGDDEHSDDEHGGESGAVAWDALVHLVKA